MEVILREHVEHLGDRGDVVKVAAGYARNFLLPRKLALAVTANNQRQIEREKKLALARDAEDRGQAEAIAQRLAHLIPMRVGFHKELPQPLCRHIRGDGVRIEAHASEVQ